MLCEKLEDYLDGALGDAQVRELEATLATDPAAGKMLAKLKSERALRAAAYASYAPTRQESAALASRFLDEAYHQPLGRVGYFIRHGAAVAAAVLVVAGSFFAGHMAGQAGAPTKTPLIVYQQTEPQTRYVVAFKDMQGRTLSVSNELSSPDQVKEFVNYQTSPQTTATDIADRYRGAWHRPDTTNGN